MSVTGAEHEPFRLEELALAFRNRGMPLEALRYDLTPTGLHYLLTHWDIPNVDADSWELCIDGLVDRPMSLSLEDLRDFECHTLPVTMECAGNGRALMTPRAFSQPWLLEAIGTASWTGVRLADVLADAGVQPAAVEVVFTGADHGVQGEVEQDYQRSLRLADALRPEVLLAYEMNGDPVQPQHGAPQRLVVPGWYGMTSVKWLARIEAVGEPFRGYQQVDTYLVQASEEDPGTSVERIAVRALMIPPGHPDFPERRRFLPAGPVPLQGRAWCGSSSVARVEVAVDGVWRDALLGEALGEFAWAPWRCDWVATPGEHVLACRATDAIGNVQPEAARWNVGGVCNNLVQEVVVSVG